ncbi:hypothetical protein [Micromonospora sp. RV43]|uniref:hypothetical protein n=1 Tax=Micromonospora sp. RV43 TaxID=1661387 RepID=UPI00064BD6DA|nr:hypothetical protein [Micromonospora sp. RV43]
MSRRYANILTAIWRNDDFRALTGGGQRLFLLLCTQPDISAAGVLSLNIKRWSRCAKDTTPQSIVTDLQELETGRFIVVDPDTEELLVRSFVRWDNGYGNPKRRPVIIRAAQEVESASVRRTLAFEFNRLGLPVDGVADSLSGSQSDQSPETSPPPSYSEETFSQVDSLSGRASASDGVVVSKGPYVSPQPSNHKPHPQPSAGAPAPPATPTPTKPDTKTKRGRRLPEDWKPSQRLLDWAAGKHLGIDLDRENEKFCLHWWSETGKGCTKINWDMAWQKWMLRADDQQPPRRGGHLRPVPDSRALAVSNGTAVDPDAYQSPADRGMANALALAKRFEERGGSR